MTGRQWNAYLLKLASPSFIKRFHDSYSKKQGDQCWEWQKGRVSKPGGFDYGSVYLFLDGINTNRTAHRVMWEMVHGPLKDSSMFVLHRCDNPPCVNPDHLFIGTQKVNMRDMVAKGRHWTHRYPEKAKKLKFNGESYIRFGEEHPRAKLTNKQTIEIRKTFRRGMANEFAKKYGVAASTIYAIMNGQRRSTI